MWLRLPKIESITSLGLMQLLVGTADINCGTRYLSRHTRPEFESEGGNTLPLASTALVVYLPSACWRHDKSPTPLREAEPVVTLQTFATHGFEVHIH